MPELIGASYSSAIICPPCFAGDFRMGRDYPVELVLDTLCKNGFAQAKRAIARGSRTEVLIPAGSAIALLYSSDGQGLSCRACARHALQEWLRPSKARYRA